MWGGYFSFKATLKFNIQSSVTWRRQWFLTPRWMLRNIPKRRVVLGGMSEAPPRNSGVWGELTNFRQRTVAEFCGHSSWLMILNETTAPSSFLPSFIIALRATPRERTFGMGLIYDLIPLAQYASSKYLLIRFFGIPIKLVQPFLSSFFYWTFLTRKLVLWSLWEWWKSDEKCC